MRLFITLALVLLTTAPLRLEAQETTPGTLQGRVVDAETGEPLAGAHVFLAGSTRGTTTDRDGRYRLAHCPPDFTRSRPPCSATSTRANA